MTVIGSTDTTFAVARPGFGRRTLSRLARGLVAGLAASVLLGLLARVLMRLAVVATDRDGAFTWLGTLGICVGWAMFTLPGAVVAASYLGRGRSIVLVAGGGLLAYFAAQVARSDLGSLDGLSLAQQAGALGAAAGVLVTALAVPWVTLGILRVLGLGRQRPV